MADLLASDVIVKEEAPSVRGIPTAATAVLGAVGVTERGPFTQQLINSFDEFQRRFGGYVANSDAGLAIKGFFENGGTELHFVRVVHFSDPTDPTTKASAAATLTLATATQAALGGVTQAANSAPWSLVSGHTVIVKVDGGSDQTKTFTGVAPFIDTTGFPSSAALADLETAVFVIDGGAPQTIVFHTGDFVDISNPTPEELAAVINAQILGATAFVQGGQVRTRSDTAGTGGHIALTGGTSVGAGGPWTAPSGPIDGTGNVANIHSITSAEAIAVIGAGATGYTVVYESSRLKVKGTATGSGHNVQIKASSTALAEFGFDSATHAGTDAGVADTLAVTALTDGAYGNAITLVVSAATNGLALSFNLKVLKSGVPVETWTNLSMVTTSADYALPKINDPNTGSLYIALSDLSASGTNTPASGTFGPLTGGLDGLGSLGDNDFIGGTGPNGDVGLRALDAVQNLTLLIVPGRATAAVHNAMITYCEVTRNGQVFTILDPPSNQSAPQIVEYVKNTAALQQLSEFGAIYWPRILVDNPAQAVFGATQTIASAPSGHIAGLYARVDAAKPSGVFTHPAGTDWNLIGARGLEMPEVKKKPKRELVFPELINPISVEPGTPIFLDGARTLKSTGNFPTIGERRGVTFIETSLRLGLTFMRHKNINAKLYADGFRTTTLFLLQQTKNGAFASVKPSEAFTVDFGLGLNPPSVAIARQVRARVGLATSKPAEFIFVTVSPDTRALDAELAATA